MRQGTFAALVAGALSITLLASPAHAQRGGGGGGRGGGSAGARGGSWGGAGYGAGARGWGAPGYGGASYYRGGYGGYGYGRGYGYGGIGISINLGGDIGLPGYGGFGYGYDGHGIGIDSFVPYGGAALYGNSNYAPAPSGGDAPVVNGNAPSVAMQSFYSGPSRSSGSAELTVKVPADAQLWLGSMQSGQPGTERTFSFPSLQGNNVFNLRCTYSEKGQLVTREKQVNMKPGENAAVDFTQADDAKSEPNKEPGSKVTPPPLPPTGLPK